jgi:hypothetical protein
LEWWPPSNWNPWPGSSESALCSSGKVGGCNSFDQRRRASHVKQSQV